MRKRSIFDRVPLYLLWALFAVLLTMGLFQLVTDTGRQNKLTLMVNAQEVQDVALMRKLAEDLPDGIRMIKVRPFSYAMLSESSLKEADMWLIRESDFERFLPDFGPVAGYKENHPEHDYHTVKNGEDEIWGVKVYDAASGSGALKEYVGYAPAEGETPEDWYLVFNPSSLHIGKNGQDTAAFTLAERLLTLP
nr:hypothetical protein [Lachnospiraceae bacterium]